MSLMERTGTLLIMLTLGLALPISLFFPASPNITFSLCGLCCFLYIINRGAWPPMNAAARNFWPLGLFVLWTLISCTWSLSPIKSLDNVGKIIFALFVGTSIYAYMRLEAPNRTMTWFRAGYIATIILLILDEILHTAILRSLRGPNAGTNLYYHGVTILILGLWPILNMLKNQHLSRPLLIYATLFIGLFYMTDHAAIVAFFASTAVFAIVYTSPKFFIRLSAVLSAIIILGFPFATKNMDAEKVIASAGSALIKASYHHRLFIIERTTQMIFEKPWIGHGLNAYRSTIDPTRNLGEEVSKLHILDENPTLDKDALGQAIHPHNFSLQVWYELGGIGAFLFAIFMANALWRISSIPSKRFEQASFMGLYSSMFAIAHISFGAWQTWWLLSIAVMLALTISQLKKPVNA